jgi:hypothetical protein
MKILKIYGLFFMSLFLCHSAYGLASFDVFAHGGYTTMESNQFTGYNAGASAMLSSGGPVGFAIGASGEMIQTKGTVSGVSTEITLTPVIAHVGLRLSTPFTRLYFLGNGGYGLGGKSVTSAASSSITNHILYGGTVMGLFTMGHVLKFGVSGVYNVHQMDVASSKKTYHEMSASFVFGAGL